MLKTKSYNIVNKGQLNSANTQTIINCKALGVKQNGFICSIV